MVRLLPNFRVQLVHHEFVKTFGQTKVATFLIEPRMTKLELREYLNSVYRLSVESVSTSNLPKRGDASKVFKKAIVIFRSDPPPSPSA